jgi:hypothetical protein
MPEDIISSATTSTEAEGATQEAPSVLSGSDQPVVSKEESILDVAGTQEKAEIEAENKRLIEADPATLTPEDVTKRDVAVKAKEAADAKALAESKAKGVPAEYNIVPPEGITLNPERLVSVKAAFKENGLTQDQAQAMVNLFVAQSKVANAEAEQTFKTFMEDSAKETMAALGNTAKTELAYVAKIKNLLSPETIDLLSSSGMGNQKSFIFDLAKIGRLISEERNVDTGRTASSNKSPADILYPSMNK